MIHYLGGDDALYAALKIALKHMSLSQLLVPVGRQPDFGKRPTFAEDKVGIKHRLSSGERGRGEASDLEGGSNEKRETKLKSQWWQGVNQRRETQSDCGYVCASGRCTLNSVVHEEL